MGKKNDCHEKKCKKNCVEYNYAYDQGSVEYALPVIDKYPPSPVIIVGKPITLSVFGYVNFTDAESPNGGGLIQFTDRVFIESGVLGNSAKVEVNATGTLLDGVTTISFIFGFNVSATGGNIVLPPGVYKTMAYSSTGKLCDKNCYITIIVPESANGSNIAINLKACDRKSCSNKFLPPV